MTLRLTVLEGKLKGQTFLLDEFPILIGRGPGVDIEIKDDSISKRHARLEIYNGNIRVLDLGSRNGLRYQGKAVNKVEFLRGRIFIGRIGVQIEFDQLPPSAPPDSEGPKAPSGIHFQQVISITALAFTLLAILVWGLQDIFWTSQEDLQEFHKVKVTEDLYLIKLPEVFAGDPFTDYSTDYFDASLAEGSLIVLTITPLQVGEAQITLPLADNQHITYTIAVISDDIERRPDIPQKKTAISLEEKNKITQNIQKTFEEASKLINKEDLSSHIRIWKSCLWVIEECRAARVSPPELQQARALLKDLNKKLETHRKNLFRDSQNHYNLYVNSQETRDLSQAIASVEQALTFTDSTHTLGARMIAFHEELLSIKRQFE